MSLCLNIFNSDTLALDSGISVAVVCRLLGNGDIFGLSRCRWLYCRSEGEQGDVLKHGKQAWMLLVRYPVLLQPALPRLFLYIEALYTL